MWIFSQNETGCVLGAFCGTSQRQQLSQNKKSVSGMLVLPVGLSLGSFNKRSTTNYKKKEAKNEGKIQCVNQKQSPWYVHTNSYQKTCYTGLWNIYQSVLSHRKQSSHTAHVTLLLPPGIVVYFSKKENKKKKKTGLSHCQVLPYRVSCDPNSRKVRRGNILADQWILDFDETKWAHHEI